MDAPGAVIHVGTDDAVFCDSVTHGGPPPPDGDGDGVPDSQDNCVGDPNPDQANNDGDALGDVCDPDDDNDGLLDVDEIGIYGTNPFLADTDGDTFPDPDEIAAGTDPLDPASFPSAAVPLLNGLGIFLLGLALATIGGVLLARMGRSA
jgi:hypothetical protein